MIVAEVKLWKTRIGVVAIDDDSPYCTFKYDMDFINSGINVSPIMMPLSDTIYQFKTLSLESFKGLPGLISDSLPDRFGNAIIDAWLAANGRTVESFSIIERLCYIGTRGMGALEFFPDTNSANDNSDEVEISKLVELSNQILNHKETISKEDKDNFKDIIKVGTSAGGARAKAIIAYNEDTGVIKSGQINAGIGFTYWILKLDGVDQKEETSHTRIEYAYYLMAKEAKINMSESKLMKSDGYYHFMTKRFDRINLENGSMDKVHMQTLGALMHRDYNEPGTLSYEEAAQAMHKLGIKQSDTEQFFRRMVFNVMSRNQDDHVKNISFLMNRAGEWSLSPAYDVTYAYNPEGRWTAVHQMLINGKTSDINKDDLLQSAHSMRIKENRALEVISEVNGALLKWEEFANEAYLEIETINAIKNSFIVL
jgi:HipA-like C-terminal domain./HipA-like N-terminal domain.